MFCFLKQELIYDINLEQGLASRDPVCLGIIRDTKVYHKHSKSIQWHLVILIVPMQTRPRVLFDFAAGTLLTTSFQLIKRYTLVSALMTIIFWFSSFSSGAHPRPPLSRALSCPLLKGPQPLPLTRSYRSTRSPDSPSADNAVVPTIAVSTFTSRSLRCQPPTPRLCTSHLHRGHGRQVKVRPNLSSLLQIWSFSCIL